MSRLSSQPINIQQTRQLILVVDDHDMILGGTTIALQQSYPDAEITTAQTSQQALKQLEHTLPGLLVVDLSMPERDGEKARTEVGIHLLETVMKRYPTLNIVVQSAHVQTLIQLKLMIQVHKGGFAVADKGLPMREMLIKVDWALKGVIYTPAEMRNGLEVKPDWMKVLQLAFREGLTDDAIAKRLNVSIRTVYNYWDHVRNALDVYPDDGKNLRIQTELRAREAGLIE